MTIKRPARRRTTALAVLAAVGALLLGACSSGGVVTVTVTSTPGVPLQQSPTGSATAQSDSPAVATDNAPTTTDGTSVPPRSLAAAIRVTANPTFGTKNIGPNDPIVITVFNGKIKDMTVTGDDGTSVAGTIGNDNSTFTVSERMAYGTTYTFAGTAVAADNSTKPITGTLSTIKPASTVLASVQLPEAGTFGIATPIILTFYGAIQDKATAQKALKVTTDKGTIEGSWGWVQDEDFTNSGHLESQVHFRPKEYWPANTHVTVTANLAGVNYGNSWGREDFVRHFTIGRSLRLVADVKTFHLVVWKDGSIYRNYPVSYGAETEKGTQTVSGTHIIQEKYPSFAMSNPQFGYYNLQEKWAQRINNNGEFIHENAAVEKAGFLGIKNVSHGCVNMGAKDAQELYGMTLYGDPVEVSNTGVKMTPSDAIYDWGYSWDQWQTLSALGA
ncbi:MAG: Ig-like domain-containing protein [Actinomycetota bacterium]|nr:Ig-like domain-containing protein [Actinomycetota bacterium]